MNIKNTRLAVPIPIAIASAYIKSNSRKPWQYLVSIKKLHLHHNSNEDCACTFVGNELTINEEQENNNNGHEHVAPHPHPSKSCSGRIGTPCVSRPGTPTPSVYVSSRYRQTQQQHHHHHNNHHHHRFVNGMASAAEKLMQASGLNQAKSSNDSGVNCSIQSLPELGEREMLLQSNLSVGEKIGSGNGGF